VPLNLGSRINAEPVRLGQERKPGIFPLQSRLSRWGTESPIAVASGEVGKEGLRVEREREQFTAGATRGIENQAAVLKEKEATRQGTFRNALDGVEEYGKDITEPVHGKGGRDGSALCTRKEV